MAMLIAFLPFIAFVIVEHLVGTLAGLIAGALISITLLVQGRVRGGQVKVLEAGTALLFTGVAIWGFLGGVESWSIAGVRLRVDLGLLAIVLTSLALSRPFTLQYARERVSEEIARSPHFLNVNMVITSVWAAAFALLVAADLILLYLPNVPTRAAVFITLGALYGALQVHGLVPGACRRQVKELV